MQRAARTDAGVHAAGNVVSLKMILEPPLIDPAQPSSSDADALTGPPSTPEQLVATINSFLPPQIRLWSFLRTRGTFNARKECDSRRYEYLVGSRLHLWMYGADSASSSVMKVPQLDVASAEAHLQSR